MAEKIEEYLLSEQAERDVAPAIERIGGNIVPWGALYTEQGHDHPLALYPSGREVMVYYRTDPRPDRFCADCVCCVAGGEPCTAHEEDVYYLVSDMGEAVRALWLRTGAMIHPAHMARVPWSISEVLACVDPFEFRWEGSALTFSGVAAEDLPRAVCRLMLAAYRVRRLEVPR